MARSPRNDVFYCTLVDRAIVGVKEGADRLGEAIARASGERGGVGRGAV
ncbi:hypothetical protein [Alienimonas chondri]|nr:hypothetical protein [Alienimonas chondri]